MKTNKNYYRIIKGNIIVFLLLICAMNAQTQQSYEETDAGDHKFTSIFTKPDSITTVTISTIITDKVSENFFRVVIGGEYQVDKEIRQEDLDPYLKGKGKDRPYIYPIGELDNFWNPEGDNKGRYFIIIFNDEIYGNYGIVYDTHNLRISEEHALNCYHWPEAD